MFKCIVFDLDETLYDYESVNTFCFNLIINKLCNLLNKDKKDILYLLEQSKLGVKKNILGTASSHSRILYFQKLCELLNIKLSHALELNNLYWNQYYKMIKPRDGVIKYFDYLKDRNILIAILTNFTAEHQFKKLKNLELLDYIDFMVTSEEVGVEKPNKNMFDAILEKTKLNKENIMMVGDSLKNDITGAINYNILAAFYTNDNKIKGNIINFSSFENIHNLFFKIDNEINNLESICNHYGQRFDFTQAGGGNISVKFNHKDNDILIIKASGFKLSDVNKENGYTILNNDNVKNYVNNLNYDGNKEKIEIDTKNFIKSNILFNCKLKPSIETPMHSILMKYTVHLHPIQCNIILTKKNGKEILLNLFPESLVVDYFTPGIELSNEIKKVYENHKIIFLLNHGLIVTSDSLDEINNLIDSVIEKIENYINNNLKLELNFNKYKVVNLISSVYEKRYNRKFITYLVEDEIVKNYLLELDILKQVSIPDKLVYCGNDIINLTDLNNLENILLNFKYEVKMIIYNNNLYVISKSLSKCKDIVDVLKSHLIFSSNKDKLLINDEINYLLNWEAEKYRQSL